MGALWAQPCGHDNHHHLPKHRFPPSNTTKKRVRAHPPTKAEQPNRRRSELPLHTKRLPPHDRPTLPHSLTPTRPQINKKLGPDEYMTLVDTMCQGLQRVVMVREGNANKIELYS